MELRVISKFYLRVSIYSESEIKCLPPTLRLFFLCREKGTVVKKLIISRSPEKDFKHISMDL